jgi:polysaccharide biosynthesis/export protein
MLFRNTRPALTLFGIALSFLLLFTGVASAQQSADYRIGAGDILKFNVFQQPDLSIEARVSDSGTISYPLIGVVKILGLGTSETEKLIEQKLKAGNFVQNPQVTLNVMQFRSVQVSVNGFVNRPGRYALEQNSMRISEVIAMAGGAIPGAGADSVVLLTERDGKAARIEIDLVELFASGDRTTDIQLRGGDSLYVNRAPVFYIYGQVQRPGSLPLDRGMTMAQAIAKAGGITLRGTEKNFRIQRRNKAGAVEWIDNGKLEDLVKPDDLVFLKESLF